MDEAGISLPRLTLHELRHTAAYDQEGTCSEQ